MPTLQVVREFDEKMSNATYGDNINILRVKEPKAREGKFPDLY